MFEVGQRVKLVPYGVYSFRTDDKAGSGDILGTVTVVREPSAPEDYSVLVQVDEEFMDRSMSPLYQDWFTDKSFDYSFTPDGRFISDQQVVLEAVE